jgi:pimeloyl-ACP methyl ester carboxylesterase
MKTRCLALVAASSLALTAGGGARAAEAPKTLRLADGVEMAYVDRGKGDPTLVFVHCGNCQMGVWRETLDAFDDTHRVVAMDLPGHGRSGANRESWTIPALGADVAALVEHLELPRVILVGNSLGGPVSLEAARRLGAKRVLAVVAVDTLQDVEAKWPEEGWREVQEAYRKDFASACDGLMLSLLPKDAPAETRERIDRETCDNDPKAFLTLFETLRTYDMAAALRDAGVPVRAINSAAYPTAVEVNRKHAPSFDVVVMDGVGHYPQVERPAEFQAHLRKLVEAAASAR